MDKSFDNASNVNAHGHDTSVADLQSSLGVDVSPAPKGAQSFDVVVEEAGRHEILIRYANGWPTSRAVDLVLAGGKPESITFPSTGSWSTAAVLSIHLDLPSGASKLVFNGRNGSGADILDLTVNDQTPAAGLPGGIGGDGASLEVAAIAALALMTVAQSEASARPAPDDAATLDDPDTSVPPASDDQAGDPSGDGETTSSIATNDPAPTDEPTTDEAGDEATSSGSRPAQMVARSLPPVEEIETLSVEEPLDSDTAIADASMTLLAVEAEATAALPMRLQAESAVRGNSGTGSIATTPTIVSVGTATGADAANADAADGDSYVDFSGLNGDFNNGAGEYVEWTFTVDAAGAYDLAFGYAFFSAGVANRPMRLDVNGALWDRLFDMPNTGANTTYREVWTRVELQAGENTIRLTSNGYSGPNIDYLDVRAPNPDVFVFQAEDLAPAATPTTSLDANRPITPAFMAAKNAVTTSDETFRVGAEGEAYLDWGGAAAFADFTVDVARAGTYAVSITYANGSNAGRQLELVDAQSSALLTTFQFSPTAWSAPARLPHDITELDTAPGTNDANPTTIVSGWEAWTTETRLVTLPAGTTTLRLTSLGSQITGPNIDKIVVALDTPADVNEAPTAAAVQASTAEDASVVIDLSGAIADPDAGDALTITASVPAAQGTVAVNGASLVFTPAANFNGTATISYTVKDAAGLTASSTATVSVSAVNDAPTLTGSLAAATLPSTGGTVDLTGLVAADVDGDALALGVRAPAGGTLPVGITVVNGALSVAGTVAPGTYAVEVFATDGTLASAGVPLSVTVESAPVPDPFTQILIQAESATLSLVDSTPEDSDTAIRTPRNPETNPTLPTGLRPGFSGSGYLDFGNTAGDKATYTFTLPTGGTFDVHFRYASNSLRPLTFSVDGGAGQSIPFAATGTTVSGPTEGFNNWAVMKVTLTLSAGAHTFALAIPAGATTGPNIDAIAITAVGATPDFSAPNALPVVTGDAFTVTEGALAVGALTATDLDGDRVTYSLSANPATDNALFAIDANTGALTFKAAPDFEAPADADNVYTVEVLAFDGTASTTRTVTVTVANDTADDVPVVDNTAPAITSEPAFTVAENTTAVGAIVATDLDGDTLTYSLTGADADKLTIGADGTLLLKAGADFETMSDANGDGVLEATVTVSDGAASVTQAITVTVVDANEAPSSIALFGPRTVSEAAAAGTVVGTVSAVDPDAGDSVSLAVDDARFVIDDTGRLVVAEGAVFDYESEPTIDVVITATDEAGLASTRTVTLQVGDVAEPIPPTGIVFSPATLTSYSSQDGGAGASVTDAGSTLMLAGNLWKRAPIGSTYTITADTKLVATVTLGASLSEIVAIGFDDDNAPFETADRSVYQLFGTQGQSTFVDLRQGATGVPGQTVTVTIDLSAHAGKTISSLVFVADDDVAGNGLGSVSFSNVQLVEESVAETNRAPVVVGGGIADQVLPERSALEIDLPFVDADGDALTYTVTVVDGSGNPAAGFSGLVVEQGTLKGILAAAPSPVPYTVTVTASDGKGGTISTSFDLTVEDVNEAPEVDAGVAYEPYLAAVGQEIEGIDLASFAEAFSDPDGDSLVLTVEDLPAGLTLNEEGVIVGTPTMPGETSFTVVATDPNGLRAELTIDFIVEGPAAGDTITVEAEAFTGLPSATAFYAAALPGASGNQVIRTNASQSAAVSTNLAQNGVIEGWYEVSITVYDETDGNSTFSLSIGDTVLASNLSFDANGAFVNPGQPRGDGGQSGNLKVITFTTPVYVDASSVATLTGLSNAGEFLRIDKLTFTRTEAAELPPTAPVLTGGAVTENVAGAVVGTLSALDPDGSAAGLTFSTADARFVIDGATLKLANGVSLDHEAGETVNVAVSVTDAEGLTTTGTVSVAVGDVNEAPTLAAGAAIDDVAIVAGTAGVVNLAAELGATDPDGTAVTYVARLADGSPLPAGMTVTNGQLQIAGTLPVGTYSVVALATDGALTSPEVGFTVTVGATPAFTPIVIQAESGVITSLDNGANATVTTIRDPSNPETNPNLPTGLRPDFSGTGYVDYGDTAGDRLTYTVTVSQAGTYDFNVRFASNTARPLDLVVNGGAPTTLALPATGTNSTGPAEGFNNWAFFTVPVTLQAGANVFSLAIPAGATTGPNVDRIEITALGTGPIGADVSADADDQPLFLSGPVGELNETEAASINFNIAGVDDDIVKVEVSFDGGATRVTVLPDADGDFTVDGSALPPGTRTATVIVTDEAGNTAETGMTIVIADDEPPVEDFSVTVQAETFAIQDVEAVAGTPADTVARTPTNKEPLATAANSGPGLAFDQFGLRPGYEGSGYLDTGNDVGDSASFTITAPSAGTYQLTIRYANGGATDRPMTVSVGGVQQTVPFSSTTPAGATDGWSTWGEVTIDVELAAGPNTISFTNQIANGPNIDEVTVSRDGDLPGETRDLIRFEEVVKINFQPAPGQTFQGLPNGFVTPAGYLADIGAAYGDRGNGFSYGWVTEASVADGTANGTTPTAQPANAHWYKNTVPGASDLQKTYAHFEYPGAGASGSRAWEMALENGTYQVTLSIGDTAGAFDSNYVVNLEGQRAIPTWVPANPIDGTQTGGGFRSTLVTKMVTVTDGRLTIDSIGGTNTEIQYIEVERVPDLTPGDGRTADLDYSFFTAPVAASLEDGQVSIALGPNGELPVDIDPTSSLVVGVNLQADGNRGPNIAYVEGIKLVETLTGVEVEIDVQISGGADSLTIRPLQQLKENTSYTLKVQDVMDLGSVENPDGALLQFQDLTTTFVTGTAPVDVPREVAFTTTTLLDGFNDGAGGYTSIEFGPDGKLYVATITGEVHRWTVKSDGSIDKASQETLSLDYLDAGSAGRRGIVGFAFDPEDPNTIWITDNAPIPREAKAFNTPEFSGRVSKITLGTGGSFENATAETYITGLPRSGGDHLTNSLEFRPNPAFGQAGEPEYLLYLSQGSNSAAGAPDNAWGNRPERLLNAAILEIDPTRDAPAGGFDVRTEPIDLDDTPTTSFPLSQFNADGTYPGMYNPFAQDAVLKIYATGVRNAYDLVWHSNGQLYVPTNGTASGGKTPQDPTQPGLDTVISNSPKQYDYLFTVDEGGYYGHPNVLRDEYVLNGGNPTSGRDPNEVVGGNDGNPNTDGYQTGVQTDPDYDLDGVYNLGYNQSPNGATEYKGNAFGSNLKGAILFAQFSTGDNVRVIKVDAEGKIIGDDVLRRPDGSVINNYIDPLDIIENPVTGQLYLMTLNRGTGASQLILLTPAPGGVTADISADADGNLAILAIDTDNPAQAVFQVNGLDDDITAIRVQFNDGPKQTVVLNAQKQFTVDLGALTGQVTAKVEVTDDALNTATASVVFTPGEDPSEPEYVTLLTIQAEDRTPADGTAVTVATGVNAQIQIRDASNPETGTTGLVNGLRPGAVGTDGNTDNTDGVPGGYADFGATNADFMTFAFQVSADDAGAAILRFRYANGSDPAGTGGGVRPLQVEVNGTIVTVNPFPPAAGATADARWATWLTVEIPVTLAAGQNTVTLRSVNATGPNIDQMEVLVPADEPSVPNDGEVVVDGVTYVLYEAENAVRSGAAAVITEDRDQSGTGFVDFVGPTNETLTWTIEVDAAGSYGIDILYALATTKTARPMTLSVNGQVVETLPFLPNSNAAESVWGAQKAVLALAAGVNTITVTAPGGVGPNVDGLRVTRDPVEAFEPDHADIVGSGRIELEATDGSANVVSGSAVDFYFTVAADGIYKLDVAANTGAANGQGLTWFLNGVELDESDFPGTGAAGEESVYATLQAGVQYQLRIVSDAPGANGIDYLDLSPAPGNANADIAVQSLDPAYFDDRLHFSFLENPVQDGVTRDFKDSGTVRISNTGTEPLTVLEVDLDGPFKLANPTALDGLTLAPGAVLDVEVLFDRAAYTPPTGTAAQIDAASSVFQGKLVIRTNDADSPVAEVDLAGFWQRVPEGGQEPNVNEIWRIFGFGNVIEGLTTRGGGENSVLSTDDVFAKTDETEVLSPYWRIADGFTAAKITQIAAFHGPGGATIGIHNPGNKGAGVTFWNHEGTDNQRLLPNTGNDTSFSTRTFTANDIPDGWTGADAFGISVAGLSTDPRLNPRGDVEVPGAQQGHTVKVFQALDADGNVIPNVFLGVMDYTGINYDYNDNLFIIEGVQPVGFGQEMVVSGLDDAAADDRLVFTSIDNPVNATQAFRNEAVITITNSGFGPLTIQGIDVGNPAAFQIVGTVPTQIAAGASAQVTVRFIGTHAGTGSGADLYKSTLTIRSDDMDGPQVIQLAGLAQEFSENGSEPTVAQIVEAFGYGTDMAQGELAGGGVVETIGDEVLMPYLQKLDGARPVEIIQIAAFLNQGNVARLGFHGLNSSAVNNLFANDDQQGQTILPDQLVAGAGSGATVARGVINQNGPFGLFISVDGRPTYSSWSDPEANRIDPNFGQLVGDDQGHLIRFFQALDADGEVIEGTYIGIQDYPGAGNYDYNDHMFVIKNVKPFTLGQAFDADGNGVNDAIEDDGDNDGTVDFFDPDTDPVDPGGDNRGAFVLGVNFGGGAIANDPVLGVPLVGQSDPRVVVSGSVNTAPGTDAASNPNGANATAGSAFKTYEDGSNWTAAISVANGTYVVVIHTQETYWNAAGQRQFDVSVNGQPVITNLDPFAVAGGDKPIAVETVVTVTDGKITLNLSADIDNAALNAVTIYQYDPPGDDQRPVSGTPFVVDADGVTIDASNYDLGGQGVAYNDAAGLQGGTNGGRAGSDVEATAGGDIGWIEAGEWLEYTIDVETAGRYDLSLLLANAAGAGRSAVVSFFRPGETTAYATSGSIANPTTASWSTFASRSGGSVALEDGEQVVRVTFAGGSQDFRSLTLTPTVVQTPFGGTAPTFSNGTLTVDATNFDNGGQGISWNDNPGLDGGTAATVRPGRDVEFVGSQNDIGFVKPGEWVEYTVNVPTAGTYTFAALAKTPVTGATIAVSLAGGAQLGTLTLADGHAGGSNFDSAAFQPTAGIGIPLSAGLQTLRLTFNGPLASNGYVLDLRSFTLTAPATQTPFGGTAPVLDDDGLTVMATAYDNGGQGVAYNDAAGLQGGTNGGRAGSAVEVTPTGAVGWVSNGEWLEYTINVEEAGRYLLSFSAAIGETSGPSRSITATFTNGGSVETVTVATPLTGTWTNFQTTPGVAVDLDAGQTVVRLTFNNGPQDLMNFRLQPAPAAQIQAALFDGSAEEGLLFAAAAEPIDEPLDPVDAPAPETPADDPDIQSLDHVFGFDLMV
ncbi:carbohydrate-binding protein [Chthonobacter rhizosphaerae]|uniref:carbohydrate-binding protein n=1 Tax=Chthonobacter rhizosphaerae TaxID=2735553 RepID=UPI0015EEE922|nr:carbohydrate-binding protein [Chthonobacter rhizosphaerae]